MGKSRSSQVEVTDYFLSIHYGICADSIDLLWEIKVDGKTAFVGGITGETLIRVNKPDLFGGQLKDGGVRGGVYLLPGGASQEMPSGLASRFGKTPTTMPAFRGVTTAFFVGEQVADNEASNIFVDAGDIFGGLPLGTSFGGLPIISKTGFYWSSNAPYVKPVSFRVSRWSDDWYEEKAIITPGLTGDNALYFGLDRSGSMAGSRITSLKAAMVNVLTQIKQALQAGTASIDIRVAWFSTSILAQEYLDATPANIDSLISFVNSTGTSGGTDFEDAADDAVTFFTATLPNGSSQIRTMFLLSDGESTGTANAAATAMADLIDRTTGSFKSIDGTAVDTYMISIEALDTSELELLDNTPVDGVPVVTAENSSGLTSVISSILFTGSEFPDSNPAHIIYEVLTNTDWGMGGAVSSIDDANFRLAADALFSENFGLSLAWNQQSSIEDFIREILDHIEGVLAKDPRTGLWTLTLLRNDYVVGNLPVIDQNVCKINKFERKTFGELTNEINVTWTNPLSEKEETVTVQDLGSQAIQGEIISDSRNYYGVRRRSLAVALGARDMRTAGFPLATMDAVIDRSAWEFTPGEPVVLVYPELGITGMVVRIGPIDQGTKESGKIGVQLIEDIYGIDTPVVVEPPETEFTEPTDAPSDIDTVVVFSQPYYLIAQLIDPTEAEDIPYPDAFMGVLASEAGNDTREYQLLGTNALGTESQFIGERDIYSLASLTTDLVQEAESIKIFDAARTQGAGPAEGHLLFIGPDDTTTMEIAKLDSFNSGTSEWTIKRGLLDTTPKAWPAGTPIWIFSLSKRWQDENPYSDGEIIFYKLLSITSEGVLDESLATVHSGTADERMHAPSRPANVQVDGVGYGTIDLTAETSADITWANRNRLEEDNVILDWDAAGVTPETNQLTKLQFYRADRTLIHEIPDLPNESYNLDLTISQLVNEGLVILKVVSTRDGFDSVQGHEISLLLNEGYGFGYGENYGQ